MGVEEVNVAEPTSDGGEQPEVLAAQVGYDRWAAIYDGEDNALIALEEPEVARMLGDVRGLQVIDLGCGTGRHALPLAAAGARVTAVDFSEGMLAQARTKAGASDIRFIAHDLAARLPFEDGAFDRVVCGLVLEHMRDVAGLFAEMRRVCRPDGFVVASAMHPAMWLRGISARFSDPTTGRDTRPRSYRQSLSDYVMAARHTGLVIDEMVERAVDEALADRMERARKYLHWPMLVAMTMHSVTRLPVGTVAELSIERLPPAHLQ